MTSVVTTLFGISIFVFIVLRLIPGNAITSAFGTDTSALSPQKIHALKVYYGIDRPVVIQYLNWIKGFFTGNLGYAFHTGTSVAKLTENSFPVTLELALFATIIGVLLGTLVGIFSASKPGSRRDFFGQIFGLIALAIPSFVLSTTLVAIFADKFHYFPNGFEYAAPWSNLWMNVQQMMFPSLVLGIAVAAPVMRTARSSFLETQEKDFVRTAIGKGVKLRRVKFIHVLRNSLNPIVTMSGIQFGYLLGGSVIVEQIFSLPGVGRQVLQGILKREYSTVQSTVMLIACCFVLINTFTDIICRYVDPRIRDNG